MEATLHALRDPSQAILTVRPGQAGLFHLNTKDAPWCACFTKKGVYGVCLMVFWCKRFDQLQAKNG